MAEYKSVEEIRGAIGSATEKLRGGPVDKLVFAVQSGDNEIFSMFGGATEDTIYEIASITKTFTGIVLADMCLRGEASLDEPVAELLKRAKVRVPSRGGKQITLRNLANQNSGLPRMPENFGAVAYAPGDPYKYYGPEHMYEFLSSYELTRDIGEKYEYSNLGFALLSNALEQRTGKPMEFLYRERIFSKAGMTDTTLRLHSERLDRLAKPHNPDGKPDHTWNFDAFAGGGGLRSTGRDMMRYARACMAMGGAPDDFTAAVRLAHEPTFEFDGRSIGLAWNSTPKFPGLRWHNGSTGGYKSFLAVIPESKTAVLCLSNSGPDVTETGFAIAEAIGAGA